MRVLVVGATGRTGREVVRVALTRGHQVRAFARSAGEPTWPDGVEGIAGDALDAAAVDAAMDGVDAVIVALSMVRTSDLPWARILTPTDLHHRAGRILLEAARRHGVRHYGTISAQGVGDSEPRAGRLVMALVRHSNIGVAYADLARAEDQVRRSDVPWTIVRPTRLTGGPGHGTWRSAPELVTTSLDSIPRADVARFLVLEAEQPRHLHQVLSLTGGPPGPPPPP